MKCFIILISLTILGISCEHQTREETSNLEETNIIEMDSSIDDWVEIRKTLLDTRKEVSKILNRIDVIDNELEKDNFNDTIKKKFNTIR